MNWNPDQFPPCPGGRWPSRRPGAERADGVGHSVNKGLSSSKDAVAELVIFYVQLRSIKAMTCGCRKLGKSRSNRSSGITVYRGDRKHQFADGRYPVTETALFHRPDRH
ncbi:hypothetical protein ACFV42_42210 [Streptomyces solisilvae]|uniref:hypothetical protein n=1 Tax=Streptomyces malaysiensis TaxID=92644 RepID=UPI0036763926